MKYFLPALIILLCIFSCNSNPVNNPKTADPAVYEAVFNDTDMNAAMEKAKSTFGKFDAAFKKNKPDSGSAAIKLKFNATNNLENVTTEYIWASGITFENGNYYGIMDLPHFTTEVKEGQKVKVNPDNVADWMYAENDTLRGGYTIRATRNKMTEQERVHFDYVYLYKIQN
ncbi:hypothetical protein BH11BAC7_BH11BAC7_30300 [soil metagenome]